MLRDFISSAAVRIVGLALSFLVGVQLARGLGVVGYGVYGLALSAVSLASMFVEFGLPQLATREVASAASRNEWGAVRAMLVWATRVVLLLASVVIAVAAVLIVIFESAVGPEFVNVCLAGAILIPLAPLANTYAAALRGLNRLMVGQLQDVLLRPLFHSALLLFVSIAVAGSLTPALAIGLQGIAVAVSLAFVYLLFVASVPHAAKESVSKPPSKKLLASAVPMALTEGMRLFHGNLPLILVGVISGAFDAGVFRVASSVGALISMPVSLVHVIAAPKFSSLHDGGLRGPLQAWVKHATLIMTLATVLLIVPFALAGGTILSIVFGGDFHLSNPPLLVLSAGTLLSAALGPAATLLNMTGHENRVARAFGISLVCLALIAPFAIWAGGAIGASLASVVSALVWNVMLRNDAKSLLGVETSLLACMRNRHEHAQSN